MKRDQKLERLWVEVLELEHTLIPAGMHVIGEPMSAEERADLLVASADATHSVELPRTLAVAIAGGASPASLQRMPEAKAMPQPLLLSLLETNRLLSEDHEAASLIHALDAGFVRPSPSGDLIRTPDMLPTGRNIHGFDPFRIPSAFAVADGARQAARLIQRYMDQGNELPETVALVLWGTDNLKTEGGPIAQALALMGAKPRFDGYGRLAGADLIPLEALGRPRIDTLVTVSGIFRDLLPLQLKLLAEAAYLAAAADEPEDMNFVKKHAAAYMAAHGCTLDEAALRVFSNADGAYGSNVNQLIETSSWENEDELAETYTKRKSFAYAARVNRNSNRRY